MTTTQTNMIIGLKAILKASTYTKLVCAKGRYIEISLTNDLYNVKGYSVKGIKDVKVKEQKEIFIENLQQAIINCY